MSNIIGTHVDVRFSRIVDGDTIRVYLPGQDSDESLRILSLDTEESHNYGSKPVTKLGKKAKERAAEFFDSADTITIEFPGNESVADCIKKYRGNFGRLLVYVYRDGIDFQETMIREGFSPYFNKYGNAEFKEHHERYSVAEREVQKEYIGIWDQITGNGAEMRNYGLLGTWWNLRARIIDDYRKIKTNPNLFNTRLHYDILAQKAKDYEKVTVFTEIKSIKRIASKSGLIKIGSTQQPFSLFIPDIHSPAGEEILNLLNTRYISTENSPRRSYTYVTGELSEYNNRPQMKLLCAKQITDTMPNSEQDTEAPVVKIVSLLPNPVGNDRGKEKITLKNPSAMNVDLHGWTLQDLAHNQYELEGMLQAGQLKEVIIDSGNLSLNNNGDEISLINNGNLQHKVAYTKDDVSKGKEITFC